MSDTGFNFDQLVAVDLETTGLNAGTELIIEVGAVKFDQFGNEEVFSTLVNPNRQISDFISDLTGITNEELRSAPTFDDIREDLQIFLGSVPLVGHNVTFDISFLRAQGLSISDLYFDTWELGALVLPTAEKLNLRALAGVLNVDTGRSHRALDDAVTSKEIFLLLADQLKAMSDKDFSELALFVSRSGFSSPLAFLTPRKGETTSNLESYLELQARLGVIASKPQHETVAETPFPDALNEAWEIAAEQNLHIDNYHVRTSQQLMSHAVMDNLVSGGEVVVEAGTGTGKSLAYVLPAVLHSWMTGEQVVISTHTKNLQEQLIKDDIPAATALVEKLFSDQPKRFGHSFQMLKGRGNYLCLDRWYGSRGSQSRLDRNEALVLARIGLWLQGTQTGDKSELYLTSRDEKIWDTVSAEDSDCAARRCQYVQDGNCFVSRIRAQARSAHVIVVNHALLLASTSTGDQVIPEFQHLIIDEGHRLEDAATEYFGAEVSLRDAAEILKRLSRADRRKKKEHSVLEKIATSHRLNSDGYITLIDNLTKSAKLSSERLRELRTSLSNFLQDQQDDDSGNPPADLYVTKGMKVQNNWEQVQVSGTNMVTILNFLLSELDVLSNTLRSARGGIDELGELIAGLAREQVDLELLAGNIKRVLIDDSAEDIIWLARKEKDIRIRCAPLHPGEFLRRELFADKKSVLVTSATLRNSGLDGTQSFDFTLNQLGISDAETHYWPAPFDYQNNCLVLSFKDIPAPNAPGHADQLHEAILECVIAAEGRTMVLFTSYASLKLATQALRGRLDAEGIRLQSQGLDGSADRLTQLLRNEENLVVFGTAAMWEGVDVPGPALSQVVMVRLPFPSPVDPIHSARSDEFDNPFIEYSLPKAILRFRQGFGRLIRGENDRGVFTILDSRFVNARYGNEFAGILPDTEMGNATIADAGNIIRGWLN